MATLESRLRALETADDSIEILNERTWDLPPDEREAADLANQQRLAAAMAAWRNGSGPRVITIRRSYGLGG